MVERIGRELHDGVNQILSSVKLRIETIGELPPRHNHPPGRDFDRVRALLDQAIQEVRRISENLRPLALDELGLLVEDKRTDGEVSPAR